MNWTLKALMIARAMTYISYVIAGIAFIYVATSILIDVTACH
ncbi:hypothetical protein [Calothrix sp. CCY 0018]